MVVSGVSRRLWLVRRMALLALRGRVRHADRFGLDYWLWKNTRPLGTLPGEPRTDDTGVLEQLIRVHGAIRTVSATGGAMVSIDVGAYIGVISLAMARFGGPEHTVHSFEADDLNFSRLRQNVANGPGSSIRIYNTAVGNQVGAAEFTRDQDPGDSSLSVVTSPTGTSVAEFMVPITTLDAFVTERGIDEIDVLKIDVEGADMDVLRGAAELLGGGRIKAIFVEILLSPRQRAEMNELLTGHGYSVAYLVRNTPDLSPPTEAAYTGSQRAPLNLLAVQPELAPQLGIEQ